VSSEETTASRLEPLWTRAAEWEKRLRMIEAAQSFLYLSTYYIEYDEYGTRLLSALDAAVERGVAVNLLLDGFGQRLGGVLMSREARSALAARLDELRRRGAVTTVYRPHRYLQRVLGGGQHVKIQVSERGEVIFGSSNITRSSFEGWNEYSVALRGPVAQVLLESYRGIGGLVRDEHLRQLREATVVSTADLALDYWWCNPNADQGHLGPLGWRGANLVTERLIAMLDQAERSVRITSFYFKPVEPVLGALVRAAERGVDVEVYHSHRDALPATELAWLAAAVSYPRLLRAGIRIYENAHGEHSKILLTDSTWAAFGSYNFEDAAHDRLAEAMLASRDDRAVTPAIAIFEELRRDPDNTPVSRETMADLPSRLKVKLALLGRFKRWM
jgi:cardiolipin synthase